MANHKSAKKRSRQNIKRNAVNKVLLTKIKNSKNSFDDAKSSKNIESMNKSLSLLNSALSKAVKKGIISKKHASRKLSSLSNQLKKIS